MEFLLTTRESKKRNKECGTWHMASIKIEKILPGYTELKQIPCQPATSAQYIV
jgi:hypothetical protein